MPRAGGTGDTDEVAYLVEVYDQAARLVLSTPGAGTVVFTPAEVGAFIKGVTAGEFDDHAL